MTERNLVRGASRLRRCAWGWRSGYVQVGSDLDRLVARQQDVTLAFRRELWSSVMCNLDDVGERLRGVLAEIEGNR